MFGRLLVILLHFSLAAPVLAQDLKLSTVSRVPFSFVKDGQDTGFSIDLWMAVASVLERQTQLIRHDNFADMLKAVETGASDAAIANISVTAAREQVMDFSQPIFGAGLQILVPATGSSGPSIWSALLSPDLLLAICAAFAMLFLGGMVMWVFERRAQPYFDRPASDAMFPAFWWALNLVVNGGFEERVPRTWPGRIFAVFLVISSLFIVSVFVARITSVMTVEAINSSVTSVNDLYGKRVGTIRSSTAAGFMDTRDLTYDAFDSPDQMFAALEQDRLDAIVFDAPILAYYATSTGKNKAKLAGPVFLREDYAIAVPSGSPLTEDINRAILELKENGTYQRLVRKWFGSDTN